LFLRLQRKMSCRPAANPQRIEPVSGLQFCRTFQAERDCVKFKLDARRRNIIAVR
jgi:hypothetical protein